MSHWDFGRQPADHRDSRPGAAGGADDPDDEDPAPYPITYERGRAEPGLPRPATPPYAPWPAAPAPDDRFEAGRFAPGQYATGQYATGLPGGGEPADDQWLRGPSPGRGATGELPRAWPDGSFDDSFEARQPGAEPWPRAQAPAARPAGTEPAGKEPAWKRPSGKRPSGKEPPLAWEEDRWLSGQPWPSPPRQDQPKAGGPERDDGPGRGRRLMLLLFAGVAGTAAAIGGTTMLLTGGHPAASGPATAPAQASGTVRQTVAASSSAAPPLTLAQAQGVLAGYTTVNNAANAKRSKTQLATIETGGSYAIDAGLYLMQQAAGSAPYPAFKPVSTQFYIPRTEPSTGPRWFVARVGNAFLSSPAKVSSTEYLLFTQATPGGPWRNAIEPYLLSGASVPQVVTGGDDLVTPVALTATSLASAPGQLPALTAASLGGTAGTAAVADPGNLADRADQRFWRGKLPTATVTDSHAPAAAGQAFALPTAGGGALVFYTDAATLTLTPPAGSMLHLTVPGLYSPSQSLARAGIGYLDQFAAYDPPAGSGKPRIVADYSGITGKS
jgi:hypothetical protein